MYLRDDLIIGLDVLKVERDDDSGNITAHIGDSVSNSVSFQGCEYWQHIGFCSLPAKATPNQPSAQVIAIPNGDRDIIIASKDIRCQQIYGSLEAGETCIFGGNSKARILIKNNDSCTIYSSGANDAIVYVSPTEIRSQIGSTVMIQTANSFDIQVGSSRLTIKDGEITLMANKINVAGGSVGLGVTPILPVAVTNAGPANVVSTCVFASV